MEHSRRATAGIGGRKRVEAVVETLANLRNQCDSLAAVAHDARNMVTALGLYCDLLEEPGVLSSPFVHYGSELRLVAAASRRLVEKLVALDNPAAAQPALRRGEGAPADGWPAALPGNRARTGGAAGPDANPQPDSAARSPRPSPQWDALSSEPVRDLAAELKANRNLLAALAGPSIALAVETEGGQRAARITAEDLTRVLVNLVKNAVEAMPSGGRIDIAVRDIDVAVRDIDIAARNVGERGVAVQDIGERGATVRGIGLPETPLQIAPGWMLLTIEDDGPGIAGADLETIFESGYSANKRDAARAGGWPACHRGLGLAITRSIVEAAGGRIRAANRAPSGARFEIELPAERDRGRG